LQATPLTRTWRAAPDEAPAVAGLLAEFRDWWGRSAPSDASLGASVERLIASPDTVFLLGAPRARAAPAGVCQLRFRFSVWSAGEECCVEDLFVREDSRRSGLGAALVDAALRCARERGCARVELDVREDNRAALALYASRGFAASAEPGGGRTLLLRRRL